MKNEAAQALARARWDKATPEDKKAVGASLTASRKLCSCEGYISTMAGRCARCGGKEAKPRKPPGQVPA